MPRGYPSGVILTRWPRPNADGDCMTREQVAARLDACKSDIVRLLQDRLPWETSDSEVAAGLKSVVEDACVAFALGSSGLLDRAFAWWKVRVRALGGQRASADQLPARLAEVLADLLPEDTWPEVASFFEHAESVVRHAPESAATGADLHPSLAAGEPASVLVEAMLRGDRITAGRFVADESIEPASVLSRGFEPALREIGARWQNGKLDPSVEHIASRVAHEFILRLARRVPMPAPDAPMVALMRAPGDEHSLGQECLRLHLAAAGLRSRIVASDPDRQALLDVLEATGAAAIAISCTRPAQLLTVRERIQWIRTSPRLRDVPVMLGGGLFTDVPQLATQLGADATATDGEQAAEHLAYVLSVVATR